MNFVSRHNCFPQSALIVLLLCVALFPGGIAAAQSQDRTLHVKVDLQPVDVQVKDAQGNDVAGLTAKDFTLLENGKPQKIAFFDTGNSPVSLVVLVDSSSSVNPNGRLGSAQAIAAQFMRTARPGDDISAMDFTDQMGPFQHLTHEQLLNPSAVTLAPAPSGGSALYDAIATALCHLQASKNLRQAVVVITDGIDQHSRITLDQLIGLVRSSRAQLFMVGLQSRPEFDFEGHEEPTLTLVSGHDIDNPAIVFDHLMKESGAESFIPNSERSLEGALKAVSNTLQAQYTLAYYPQKTSKKFRKIEVKVDRRGDQALARSFVGSTQDAAESVHFDEGTCIVSPQFHPYPYESKVARGPSGMVYRENFSDPRSGWPEHENSHYVSDGYELSNPKAKIRDLGPFMKSGGLAGEAIPMGFQENVVAAYGPWWSDFRASAKVNMVLTGINSQLPYETHPAAGLVFRLNQEGYYALLLSGATGTKELSVKLVKREFQGDTQKETEIVPWTHVATRASSSGTEISVEDIGDRISMFVDGEEVKSARDDSFNQGYVGFVVSGPGRAIFRNLAVEQK